MFYNSYYIICTQFLENCAQANYPPRNILYFWISEQNYAPVFQCATAKPKAVVQGSEADSADLAADDTAKSVASGVRSERWEDPDFYVSRFSQVHNHWSHAKLQICHCCCQAQSSSFSTSYIGIIAPLLPCPIHAMLCLLAPHSTFCMVLSYSHSAVFTTNRLAQWCCSAVRSFP